MPLKKKKWKFDLEMLQKGDVLFTRSKFVGTGIAKATKGRFGHVMLLLDSMVIHADTKGVWSKNPQRILMNDQSRLAAYRLKNPLSEESLQRIESYARSRVGSLYSIPQAYKSIQKPIKRTTDRNLLDRQFCSRLLAQSFAEAGVNLVSDIDYCTPNEIADSELLHEVSNAVVPASAVDIEFCATPDFNMEIQIETYKWLNQVRALSEKHQLRPMFAQSDVAQWVLDHPQFDAVICDYIQCTKYLSLYDADKRKNPWRYTPILMFAKLISHPFPETVLAFECKQNHLNLERVNSDRLTAIQNSRSGLGYCKLEEQLLTNRLALMYEWKRAVDYASQFIGSQPHRPHNS